ncbi:SMC-Scp complex subunit ScpB, partial [Dietzia natronolimnaea]|nr:SMC-Scp complex subunit ScpB [Dietzia natronolimnaea]
MDVTEGDDVRAMGPDGDDDELDEPGAPPLRARLEALLLVVDQPTAEGALAAAAG